MISGNIWENNFYSLMFKENQKLHQSLLNKTCETMKQRWKLIIEEKNLTFDICILTYKQADF